MTTSPKVAIYARYSSDLQREASIEDQILLCTELAGREGWHLSKTYSDQGISGASMMRPGIQSLMEDAQDGEFDIVIAEALDRLSRDQEDIAGIYKRLSFAGVKIRTLSEGDVSDLHIGLKGTMNALFLKDLAHKTRRGLRGRVEAGKSGGGKCYGYDVVKRFDADGKPINGERAINQAQAAIVKDIFEAYAQGKSPKAIAADLNDRGIKGPSGKGWQQSTINGNRERGTGILNNELYIGRLIWNRLTYLKEPGTNKRVSRLNPESEWSITECPDHRIVPQDLWKRVKARQAALDKKKAAKADGSPMQQAQTQRRPVKLLSGLLKCSACGGGFAMISQTQYGCSNARNKGKAFCTNKKNFNAKKLESMVLDTVRQNLMAPELVEAFSKEYRSQLHELTKRNVSDRSRLEAELKAVSGQVDKLVDSVANGMPADVIAPKVEALQTKKNALEADLQAVGDEPEVHIHRDLSVVYRKKVEELADALEHEATHSQAKDLIRSLIEKIVMTLQEDGSLIPVVHGDLAGILNLCDLAQKTKPSLPPEERASQVKLVAGAHNPHYLHTVRLSPK